MRVAFIAPYPQALGSPVGGVEAAMEALYSGLSARGEVEALIVDVRTEYQTPTSDQGELGPIYRLPAGRIAGRTRRSRQTIREILSMWRPDIVHSQGMARFLPPDYPGVLTVHGIVENDLRFESATRLRKIAKRATTVRTEIGARDRCTNVVCISRFNRDELPAAPNRRTWLIPNAISPDYFTAARTPYRQGIIYAGVLWTERKGVDILLRAFRVLLESAPQTTLTFAGPGGDSTYGMRCQSLAKELGISDAVTFSGPKSRHGLMAAIASARCLVLPSFGESAPMVIAEALALGTPVVATTVGGLPEMVAPPAGALVEPGDVVQLARALQGFVQMGDLSFSRSQAAAEALGRRYDPKHVADLTVGVYRQVLDDGGSLE